jgi:hypothetical protein
MVNGGASETSSAGLSVDAAHRVGLMVVVAVMLSVIGYVAAGLIVLNGKNGSSDGSSARVPIYVAALFIALGSVALRRSQMRWLRLATVAEVRGAGGLIRHLLNTTIILAALAELIGLLGLVLCFIGGDMRDVLIMGAVALLIVLPVFPRRRVWEKTVADLAPAIPESETDTA